MDARGPTPRHIIKMPKVKDKERILKTAQGKLVSRWLPNGRECRRMGEEVKGLRSINR